MDERSTRAEEAEIVVIGAGMVGLVNALQYAKRGFRVALIDDVRGKKRSFKVGESLLIFSNVFLRIVAELDAFTSSSFHKEGLWMALGMEGRTGFDGATEWALAGRIPERWREAMPDPTLFRCLYREAQIVRPEAEEIAQDVARRHPGVTFMDAMRVDDVEIREDGGPHVVRWVSPSTGERGEVRARWVIDCSGRNRLLATRRGHAVRLDDGFQTTALWAQFAGVSDDTLADAWIFRHADGERLPRHYTTVHLWGRHYWVWVIRLSKDRVSVGVTFDQRAQPPGEGPREQFWGLIRRFPLLRDVLSEERMLEFRMYKKVQHMTDTFVSPHRYAMAGDAASVVDAYYSQGMSLALLTSWHVANIVEGDLRRGRLDEAYLRRVNRCTRQDWHMLRNMIVEKYTDAILDSRFFILSHMLDSIVIGPVYTWRRYLIRWLVETGGDSRREGALHRELRAWCEKRLYFSHSTPWSVLPPELVQRAQRALQRGLGERARWRLRHGITLPPLKFVRRPDAPYTSIARMPFFGATGAGGATVVDLSPEHFVEPPEARLTGTETITRRSFGHYATMVRHFVKLYALDWAETAVYRLRLRLGLPLAGRGGRPAAEGGR